MFRQLAQRVQLALAAQLTTANTTAARLLVGLHPAELTALLELAWNFRANNLDFEIGHPERRSDVAGLGANVPTALLPAPAPALTPPAAPFVNVLVGFFPNVRWEHLIYAYMIENTRVYEIFGRLLRDSLHGEKLGRAQPESQKWLRNTEELFYRDPPPFFVMNIMSHVRPDLRATRRNAYQRMFAMDLNHGTDDNKPYQYIKADAANNEFVATFEEFLGEVWIGMTNCANIAGANPTDDAKIAILAERLHDMFISRRQYGNLSREEFAIVSMMSWFHLTLETNLPIIVDLRAEAEGPEQRLFKIAERVGLPAHGLSKSYFDIANAISEILIQIETGFYNSANVANIPLLYNPMLAGSAEPLMRQIITHWSIITGRDMKARKVVPS